MSHFAKRFWPPRFFSKAYWGTGEATPGEVTLSGQQATAVGGVLVPGITVLLIGQEATAAGGALTPSDQSGATLSGQQVAVEGGTLGVVVEVPLVGQGAEAQGGVLSPTLGEGATLTGQQAVAGSGTLAPAVVVGLTGAQVVVSAGEFFGAEYQTEGDFFVLASTVEMVAVPEIPNFFAVPVVSVLLTVTGEEELVSTEAVNVLWAQQQVEELFAFVSDNDEAVIS